MKGSVVVKYLAWAAAVGCAVATAPSCGSHPPDIIGHAGGATGAGGTVVSGGSGGSTLALTLPDAMVPDDSPSAPPTRDANCGSQTSSTSEELVDVLLVLDRSGSMNQSIADDCCCATVCSLNLCADTVSCAERWPTLTSAVNATVSAARGILWGLKFFASPAAEGQLQTDNCALNPGVEVPVGSSASAIQARIAGVSPGNNTPTAKAITAATAYLQTVNDPHTKAILLATDGEPNCGTTGTGADVPGALAALQSALAAGFKVYVIGIGPSVGNLDDLARAGGTDHYYPATSAAELASALAAISKAVLSCTFTIDEPPAGSDAGNLAVYADGALLAKDPSNGWSLGDTPRTLLLNGPTCDRVKSGDVHQVQVLFGCELPPPLLF